MGLIRESVQDLKVRFSARLNSVPSEMVYQTPSPTVYCTYLCDRRLDQDFSVYVTLDLI